MTTSRRARGTTSNSSGWSASTKPSPRRSSRPRPKSRPRSKRRSECDEETAGTSEAIADNATAAPVARSRHRRGSRCAGGAGTAASADPGPGEAPQGLSPPSQVLATAPNKRPPPREGAFALLAHGVLGGLDRAGADDLPGRLGLEHHLFARERVGALARLGRGLLDDHELGEARHQEQAVLLELLVTDVGQRLHDALDVTLGKLGGGRDLFDQLRFRHLGGHRVSSDSLTAAY